MTQAAMKTTMDNLLSAYGTNTNQLKITTGTMSTDVAGMKGAFNAFVTNDAMYNSAVKANTDLQTKEVATWQNFITPGLMTSLKENFQTFTTQGELAITTAQGATTTEITALNTSMSGLLTTVSNRLGDETSKTGLSNAVSNVAADLKSEAAITSSTYTSVDDINKKIGTSTTKITNAISKVEKATKNIKVTVKTSKKKATGTKKINKEDIYTTQERGGEIITTKDGVLIPLKAGDGVVPAQLTEKLFEMARNYPDLPSASNV